MSASSKVDFIDIVDFEFEELSKMLDLAFAIKRNPDEYKNYLSGKSLGLIFDKPSTRTRISFDLAMQSLGGHCVVIDSGVSHVGTESVYDTAKVLERFFDCVAYRTFSHQRLIEFSNVCSSPVVNALTNYSHPCQIIAAWMTFVEKIGSLEGKKLVWLGDGNNVLISYMQLASKIPFDLVISTPKNFAPMDYMYEMQYAGAKVSYQMDPAVAVEGADVVITDTWISMGDSNKSDDPEALFWSYRVTADLMTKAGVGALFSHCLPAYRGREVDDDVIDSENSVVFDEAENRLHAQKGILCYLLRS